MKKNGTHISNRVQIIPLHSVISLLWFRRIFFYFRSFSGSGRNSATFCYTQTHSMTYTHTLIELSVSKNQNIISQLACIWYSIVIRRRRFYHEIETFLVVFNAWSLHISLCRFFFCLRVVCNFFRHIRILILITNWANKFEYFKRDDRMLFAQSQCTTHTHNSEIDLGDLNPDKSIFFEMIRTHFIIIRCSKWLDFKQCIPNRKFITEQIYVKRTGWNSIEPF